MKVMKLPTRLVACVDAAPRGVWDSDAFEEITDADFPDCEVDDYTGVLSLSENNAAILRRYFAVFGLRVPKNACFENTYDLYYKLKLHYAKPAAMVLVQRDPRELLACRRLARTYTEQDIEYGKAVASRDTVLAARLARLIFLPQGFGAFCC